MQYISKYELIEENSKDEIVILTKNDFLYSFLTHTFKDDSIFGKGYVKSVESRNKETNLNHYLNNVFADPEFSQSFTGKIALDDIIEIRKDKINWDSTKLLIAAAIGLIIIVGGLIMIDDFGQSFD